MSLPRKILCTAVLAVAVLAGAMTGAGVGGAPGDSAVGSPKGGSRPAAAGNTGPADLLRVRLSQAGRKLVLSVRTAAPLALARLERLPDARGADSRYLCLTLRAPNRRGARRLCLGGARDPRGRVGLELLNARGKTTRTKTLAARVKRHGKRKLVLALVPAAAGLTPQRYRWRVTENRRGCGAACEESFPRRGSRSFRLRPVRAVGCTGGTAGTVRNGPRDRRVVALTFDDGPGYLTDDFLSVLRDKRVAATFFVVGQEVPGRAATMRRILREGHEIGNHTTHHDFYPSYWDLAGTNALIRSAARFQPCLFRPPGGVVSSSVVDAAARAGMKTVLWDVDPGDWSGPSSGAVRSRVVGAVQPGSIVVMHDGGGSRTNTLAALPAIVDDLRGRGYRFATVSQLLGNRLIYRPYG